MTREYFNYTNTHPELYKSPTDVHGRFQNLTYISWVEDNTQFVNLTLKECEAAFNTEIVPAYSDVLFFVKNITMESTTPGTYTPTNFTFTTMVDLSCHYGILDFPVDQWHENSCVPADVLPFVFFNFASDPDKSWNSYSAEVEYCLAKTAPSFCELDYSIHILMTVIILNILKIVLISWTAYKFVDGSLTTVGDTIQSFLRDPDLAVRGLATAGYKEFAAITNKNVNEFAKSGVFQKLRDAKQLHDTTLDTNSRKWFHGAARSRW